jgi:hypothetical protein
MQDLSCSNMKATPSRLYNLILIRGWRPSIIFPERTLKVESAAPKQGMYNAAGGLPGPPP